LSDVLWALAFAETVYVIKKSVAFCVIASFCLTVAFEMLQYFGIVRGTGDIWDIIFVAIFLSIYYTIKKRGKMNEREKI
jgi:glycopeptide antibiotics resistance protein